MRAPEPGSSPAPSVERLIARLEMATEGSRDLDDAIFDLLHPPRIENVELPEGFGEGPPHNFGRWTPEYTASLDAALRLVPEDTDWCVGVGSPGYAAGLGEIDDDGPKHVGRAATPALALCIAALHARQALATDGAGSPPMLPQPTLG
jgi:hypothetical protein